MPDFDRAIVEEIKALDTRRCEDALAQGDRVLLLIPMGKDGAHNGAKEALRSLAEQTGIDEETLQSHRFVAHRVPPSLRGLGARFSAYKEAAQAPDDEREALLIKMRDTRPATPSGRWTVDSVRAEMRRPPRTQDALGRALRTAVPDRAADAVAEALTNPAVAEAFAAGAAAPDSAFAQALQGLNDVVVERRLEEALSEPTESTDTVARRVKAAKDESAPYQYDRLKQTLSAFFARYSPEDVAEAIVASPHTDRIDLYLEGAEQVVVWFRALHRALREGSRPRLVGAAESAS